MTSANAFYNPLQQQFTTTRLQTKPNIAASEQPFFGTSINTNPNFGGHLKADTFQRSR